MISNKLFPILIRTFVLLLSLTVLTSCDKDDQNEMDDYQQSEQEADASAQSFFQVNNENSGALTSESSETECIQIVYPITINYPDGSTQSTDSDEALENLIEDWYVQNPNADEDPELQFPITVITKNGDEQTVNDEEILCELFEDCYEEYEEGEYEGIEFDDFEDCFTFIFPITAILPDGNSVTVQDEEELEDVIEAYYEANPSSEEEPSFQYPITVTYEDGTSVTINSDEELEILFIECIIDDEFEFEEDCFTLIFPITFSLPDGSINTVNNEEEATAIIAAYYVQNPDFEEEPELEFPVNIELEDGSQVTVNDEDELEDYEDECE